MTDVTEKDLQKALVEMNKQKRVDDMDEVKAIVETLNSLGIYATFAQVWEQADDQASSKLVFGVVIPEAGFEELKNIIRRAVMADISTEEK